MRHWCDTPKEIAKTVDVVMTMVGYPHDVEEVYFGENGILDQANEGTIQLTLQHPHQHWQNVLMKKRKSKEIYILDAPVSGGDIGAKEGRLAIMIGGERRIYIGLLAII